MFKKLTLYIIIGSTLFNPVANSCTVWGRIDRKDLIIAKNRDFYPGNQQFRTVRNDEKYDFFGLYGDNQYDGKYTIKMGINETGLVVFMTFASTVPLNQRSAKVPYYNVMETILENYKDIDSIYKNSKQLFKDSTPVNYIFADRHKALICEIGLNNNYKCLPYARNKNDVVAFAQTNHYILNGLEQFNLTPQANQQTSYYRLNKINELMDSNLHKLDFNKFIEFSLNTEAVNDNPPTKFDEGFNNTYQDNSIFRTFNSHPDRKNKDHPNSDQDVSTMIIDLPIDKNKPIELYLRIINQIKDSNDSKFTQKVQYTEAKTTLETAINIPNSIIFSKKSCIRTINDKYCKPE
jgi:hypothetical protein